MITVTHGTSITEMSRTLAETETRLADMHTFVRSRINESIETEKKLNEALSHSHETIHKLHSAHLETTKHLESHREMVKSLSVDLLNSHNDHTETKKKLDLAANLAAEESAKLMKMIDVMGAHITKLDEQISARKSQKLRHHVGEWLQNRKERKVK